MPICTRCKNETLQEDMGKHTLNGKYRVICQKCVEEEKRRELVKLEEYKARRKRSEVYNLDVKRFNNLKIIKRMAEMLNIPFDPPDFEELKYCLMDSRDFTGLE